MRYETPLIIGFEGRVLDKSLKRHLLEIRPAGVALFKRNIASLRQTRRLICAIKDLLGDPIVAIDFEGGLVSRFPPDTPVPPSAFALGRLTNPELIEASCRIQAELLASLGINLNFAPVLDIFASFESGAIGTRAFSSDPQKVAEFGEACIAQFAQYGVGTSAKHFPGQGRTAIDTHFSQGTVSYRLDELERTDLYPFRRAIAADVPAIMVSHVQYSSLDGMYPASMSSRIVEGLLRSGIGYRRLAIADCVEMAGLSAVYTPEEIVTMGLQAGIDLWISSYSLNKSYAYHVRLKRAYEKAVRSNRECAEKARRSQTRIRKFIEKFRVKPTPFRYEESFAKMKSIHRVSLQKFRQAPIPRSREFALIELSNSERSGIKAGEEENIVCNILRQQCSFIAAGMRVLKNDMQAVQAAFAKARERRWTPVVLTANAFRQKQYNELAEFFKTLDDTIHIALLDRRDLCGVAANEWATWGYNGMTGFALAEELEAHMQ